MNSIVTKLGPATPYVCAIFCVSGATNVGPTGFFWAIPWACWLLVLAWRGVGKSVFILGATIVLCVPLYLAQTNFPSLYYNGIGQQVRVLNNSVEPKCGFSGSLTYVVISGIEPHYDFEGFGNYYTYVTHYPSDRVGEVKLDEPRVRKDYCFDFNEVTMPPLKTWSKIMSIGMFGPALPFALVAIFSDLLTGHPF